MKRILFLLFTLILTGLFGVVVWMDTAREWTGYQRQFFHSLTRAERKGLAGGIHQVALEDLRRIDRCTTCHVAIDKPQLALAEQPFTAHPGTYLESHPPEQFGCTVCHGGQGLATDTKAAHGEVKHWEEPLLRGPLIQSSCYKCHGDVREIEPHAPRLVQGMTSYKQLGCAGCHTVNGFGQNVSVDLSDMGEKPWQLLDFTFVHGEERLSQWVEQHFQEPRRVTPGFRAQELPPGEEEIYPTFMPNYGLNEEQARALTVYMLSLKSQHLPAAYVHPPAPQEPEPVYASSVEAGKAVFQKFGCAGCHGLDGVGGRRSWNAWLGDEAPSLVPVAHYYDRQTLKEFIRNGRQPVPRSNPARPTPPLYMPAWKDRIPDAQIDQLVDYVLSLGEPLPGSPPANGAPQAAGGNP
ncbi:MAG: c-type cytochrome [Candidatus Omnitrophica bacterium]|nr:c-type cytochrome [Candidatus Omnitrophota bacterium]